MASVRLIHWDPEERKRRADILDAMGNDVKSDIPSFPQLMRELRQVPPEVIIIDLSRIPSQGRDLGIMLRKTVATRSIPILFVDGEQEKIARVKSILPDAEYGTWETIRPALRKSLAREPRPPVVPRSVFEAYAGVPLTRKLGIREGMQVALVGAPEGFRRKLKSLPERVRFVSRMSRSCDVTIWFQTTQRAMIARLGALVDRLGDGKVWIVWKKQRGRLAAGLTQATVRKAGLDAGLVDYKICSIDEVWSGLLFTKRKAANHRTGR